MNVHPKKSIRGRLELGAAIFALMAVLGGCSQITPAEPASNGANDAEATSPPSRTVVDSALAMTKETLRLHRIAEIDRLRAYAEAGIFPENPSMQLTPIHMFKDAAGRRCAVANLIHLDGLDDLVDKMAREHNDVVVADQASGPLHDWVLTSGLTNEEVRQIQGAGFEGIGGVPDKRQELLVINGVMRMRLLAVVKELTASTDSSLELAYARLADSDSTRHG
jgi:hypothetical protein